MENASPFSPSRFELFLCGTWDTSSGFKTWNGSSLALVSWAGSTPSKLHFIIIHVIITTRNKTHHQDRAHHPDSIFSSSYASLLDLWKIAHPFSSPLSCLNNRLPRSWIQNHLWMARTRMLSQCSSALYNNSLYFDSRLDKLVTKCG